MQSAVAESWAVPTNAGAYDPLLASLVHVTGLLGRPWSAEALSAGLPVPETGLTPELFVRAAARAGLTARVIARPLAEIPSLVLPVVLLLNDRQACVLVARGEDGRAQVLLPESGGVCDLDLAEIAPRYSGHAVFVQRRPSFDARSEHSAVPQPRHWFWSSISKSWPIYGEALVASLLINLFALVTPFFTMNVYDRVVPNLALETLWVLTIGVALVFGFDFLMRTLRAYFIDVAGKRVDVILSANIFARVLGIRMDARPASVGAFANNVQEFESFREFVTSATITTLVDLPFALLFIAAMAWIGGPIAWIPLAAVPLIVGFGLLVQVPLSRVVQESFRHASQRQATLIESLAGLETLRTQRAEGPAQRRWEQSIGQIARLGLRARFLSSVVINFASFVQQLAYVAVVVWRCLPDPRRAPDRRRADRLHAADGTGARTARADRGPADALAPGADGADVDRPDHDPARSSEPSSTRISAARALRGGIEFRDVTFGYPGQQVLALRNVSFRIAPGERVALIGRIGSGKTTIEKLVLGLYAPNSGSILIDGIDSRQIDPVELRRDIGYVPQDIVLFYGTVRDNIVLGAPRSDDAAVLRAAEQAGIREFIDRHPLGFSMPVGERGEGLSGGQRQAIAVARAYLQQPPVLLLDEPSNAMDNRSEEIFKERLARELDGRTLLLITHRASLLSLVDRIIVLEAGSVAADGPRDQVLAALAGGRIGAGSR